MADLFISYAREDRPRAEALAKTLEAQGYDVFWDSEIPPGKSWADYLEAKLRDCKAMLVLWSSHSVASQWVREEARVGRDAGKLIPVLLDNASPPFGFGEVQAANLTTWQGEADHADWKRLLAAIAQATGAKPDNPAARSATPPPQQAFQQPPQNQPGAFQQNQTFQTGGHAAASAAKLSPMGYIRKCLANYANGKGRAGRAEYWWFTLFTFALVVAAFFVDASNGEYDYYGNLITPVAAVVALALLAPSITVASRRLHDAGLSGWIAITILFPIAILIIGLLPGKPEPNEHGPPPA